MSNLIAMIQAIIGLYVPNMKTVYYYDTTTSTWLTYETIADGIASLNIEYIVASIVMILTFIAIYKLFRCAVLAFGKR